MATVYIALGSNLGNKEENFAKALDLLAKRKVEILAKSSFYLTKPYGVLDQPDFLNGVIKASWEGTPRTLLRVLQEVEQVMGRERKRHWGERNIDLDILLFDKEIIKEQDLIVPHPDMENRLFVLEPLVEIAPKAWHPVLHKTGEELLCQLRKR